MLVLNTNGQPNESWRRWLDEPVANAFGGLIMDVASLPDYFDMRNRKEGLSLFASVNGIIIGERHTEPLDNFLKLMTEDHFETYREYLEPFIRLTKFAVEKINHWITTRNIDVSKVAHFCGLAIDPAYRSQGLAGLLVKESIMHLKSIGYNYIVVETTGNYGGKIMENNGGICIGFITYEDYCNRYLYPKINDHIGYSIYVIDLSNK